MRQQPRCLLNRRGIALLESVIACLILTAVLTTAGIQLMKYYRSITDIRQTDRSKLLADMVFEQYVSFGSDAVLRSHDHLTPVTPAVFFNTVDNMGYDHYTLTTQANCAGASLACNVTVNVYSPNSPRSKSFVRSFNMRTVNSMGTTVDVWVVKGTCDSSNPSACSGISGFEVSADSSAIPNHVNSRGTRDVLSITGPDGHAVLRNVAVKNGVVISARKPGSPTVAPQGFSQGYYRTSSDGSVVSRAAQTVNVSKLATNTVIFGDFQPLGKVEGTLSNDSNGPREGMLVLLSGIGSTGFGLVTNSRFGVVTDASGHYVFNNVVPSSLQGATIMVTAAGDPGSNPQLSPADSLFRYGYSNARPYAVDLAVPVNQDSPPSVIQNVIIRRLGSLRIEGKKPDGTAVTDRWYVTTRLPATLFAHAEVRTYYPSLTDGGINLFNLYDVDGTTVSFKAVMENSGGSVIGGVDNVFTHVNTGGENKVILRAESAYSFQGVLVDSTTSTPLPFNVRMCDESYTYCVGVYDSSGNFRGHVLPPITSTDGSFNAILYAESPGAPGMGLCGGSTISMSGTVSDQLTDEPLEASTVLGWATPYSSLSATTNSSGNYSLGSLYGGPYQQMVRIQCDSGSMICYPDNPQHEIRVDSRVCGLGVRMTPTPVWFNRNVYIGTFRPGDVISNANIQYPLDEVFASGHVTDATTGLPVPGVKVCDTADAWLPCGMTDSNGAFRVMAAVTGREKNRTTGVVSRGVATVFVPDGQTSTNGQTYATSSATYFLTTPANFSTSDLSITVTPIPGSI